MKPKIVVLVMASLMLSVQSCKKEKNASSKRTIDEKVYAPKAFDSELKGFKKVLVKSGTAEKATITLPVKELAYYDVDDEQWAVEPGTYTIKIGKSSRDIPIEASINIE